MKTFQFLGWKISWRENTFLAILRDIHLAENISQNYSDTDFKVRENVKFFNANFKETVPGSDRNLTVNEVVISYYGPHSAKQFMRGKPIRFGCKVSGFGFLYRLHVLPGKIISQHAIFRSQVAVEIENPDLTIRGLVIGRS